ncbi:hypothetical protein [Algicola sagamiensis]|uniref:hypothetical protein n=1 Tax=Algicola sagamiensis TaxID=163869 RepID=UPI00035DE71F|nr:hypothetical protein [Algicola sagamiensis]
MLYYKHNGRVRKITRLYTKEGGHLKRLLGLYTRSGTGQVRWLGTGEVEVPNNTHITLLTDNQFVDYDPNHTDKDKEASNLYRLLEDNGLSFTALDSLNQHTLERRLNLSSRFIFPNYEKNNDLDESSQTLLRKFVSQGGKLFVFSNELSLNQNFLSACFGWSLSFSQNNSISIPRVMTGGFYNSMPGNIPGQNDTFLLSSASLPAGSQPIYQVDISTQLYSAVVKIPYGTGEVCYFGWDWFNALPVGTEDGGWGTVLDLLLRN